MQSSGLQMPASSQLQLARVIASMTAVHVLPELPPVTLVDTSCLQLDSVTGADRKPTVELNNAEPVGSLTYKTEELPTTRASSNRKRKSWSIASQTPGAVLVTDSNSPINVKQLQSETEHIGIRPDDALRNAVQMECTSCDVLKSSDHFYKTSRLSRGLFTQCKACTAYRRTSVLQAKRAYNQKLVQNAEELPLYQCGRCQKWQSADQFYSRKHTTLGHSSRCKACKAECNASAQSQPAQADAATAEGWQVYLPPAYTKLYWQDAQSRTIHISTPHGQLIIIDTEQWSRVRDHVIGVERGQAYVVLDGRHRPLDCVVMNDDKRMTHVNGNLLDCRKANLRVYVPKSEHSGVRHEPSSSAWRCSIRVEGQQVVRSFTCHGHGRAEGHALYEAARQAAARFRQEEDALSSVQLTEDYRIEDDDRYLAVHSIP